MYPSETHLSNENSCSRCHFRRDICLCSKVPELDTSAAFFLLVHKRELHKPTNTGHLLLNSLSRCDYTIWSRTMPPDKLLALLAQREAEPKNRPVFLVFPESHVDNPNVEVTSKLADGVSEEMAPLLILIDATWQEAIKIYRRSAYLQGLPVLSLQSDINSRYTLRKNQQAQGLSTVEVGQELLLQLGEKANAQRLQQYFEDFLQHYEAQRSNRSL